MDGPPSTADGVLSPRQVAITMCCRAPFPGRLPTPESPRLPASAGRRLVVWGSPSRREAPTGARSYCLRNSAIQMNGTAHPDENGRRAIVALAPLELAPFALDTTAG